MPCQMWTGTREQISPAILAVVTLLIAFSLLFMVSVKWLRRRGRTEQRVDEAVDFGVHMLCLTDCLDTISESQLTEIT